MNLGIKDLVKIICNIMDFKGSIKWDSTKPDGPPRRCLNTEKAFKELGFKAKTGFNEGLKKTINWYLKKDKNK